jgi:hypothetical protein
VCDLCSKVNDAADLLVLESHVSLRDTKSCIPSSIDIPRLHDDSDTNRGYKFDKVIAETADQQAVFQELQMAEQITRVIQGYNTTVFAYGQTSSGKTFTMEGYEYVKMGEGKAPKLVVRGEERHGLVQRSIAEVYRQVTECNKDKLVQTSVTCSFIQIYSEKIYDLLNFSHENSLRVRWTKDEQFAVENLYCVECRTALDAIRVYNHGIRNRFMAGHKLNIASSRSHTIFTITIRKTYLEHYASFML